jgi:hypothetical protein
VLPRPVLIDHDADEAIEGAYPIRENCPNPGVNEAEVERDTSGL